ncbi:hypothetical protein Glove_199g82 [Diversispora epigaea]|uniref:Uncharacterized protein n=1 Tax=Diversispora epigaea TaxID=1348612 RepID=A0A397IT47_9GLOM|nr:hypothetical protein Glove_199g82 [Diversispora epigaea]
MYSRNSSVCLATDMHGTNSQRMNTYKKLGDYLQDAQLGNTVTVLKRELHEQSYQNGAQIYQIATRIYLHAKLFWGPEIAILGKKVEIFERFLQLCETMDTKLMEDLLKIGVGSQELSFEGENVCGEVNWQSDELSGDCHPCTRMKDEKMLCEDEGYCTRMKNIVRE